MNYSFNPKIRAWRFLVSSSSIFFSLSNSSGSVVRGFKFKWGLLGAGMKQTIWKWWDNFEFGEYLKKFTKKLNWPLGCVACSTSRPQPLPRPSPPLSVLSYSTRPKLSVLLSDRSPDLLLPYPRLLSPTMKYIQLQSTQISFKNKMRMTKVTKKNWIKKTSKRWTTTTWTAASSTKTPAAATSTFSSSRCICYVNT